MPRKARTYISPSPVPSAPPSQPAPKDGGTALTVELLEGGSLEQPIVLPNLTGVFRQVDSIVDYAVENASPDYALKYIGGLFKLRQITDEAAARAITRLSKRWASLGMTETFIDSAVRETGKQADTIRRYLLVGTMFDDMEAASMEMDLILALMGRPLQDQIAIAQAQQEHGKFKIKEFRRLAKAATTAEVRSTLRKLTGREAEDAEEVPSKMLTIQVKANGNLEAWQNGKHTILGQLLVSPKDLKDPLRAKGISRLARKSQLVLDSGILLEG